LYLWDEHPVVNNTLLNKHWVKIKSKRKLENSLRQMKVKNSIPKLMGCNKSNTKREGSFLR